MVSTPQHFGLLTALCVLVFACSSAISQDAPDISSVEPDLTLPPLEDGEPRPGKRVKQSLAGYDSSRVYHVVCLPSNYDERTRYPVIVEYAGNGGYRNRFGDTSDGVPEGSKLGYGISAGRDFIWVCLPFVTGDGCCIARQWWGSPPEFSPENTVTYAKLAVADLKQRFSVDANAILLCGFSRGAIACNFIGLHDDELAKLWCGFVAYSHYDGVRDWGLPGTDRESAKERLHRLGGRPQFICHETMLDAPTGLHATEAFIRDSGSQGNFTFVETGFRNHNDAWILRESSARQQLRAWVRHIPVIDQAIRR